MDLKFRVIDHSLGIEKGTKIHQDIKYFVKYVINRMMNII